MSINLDNESFEVEIKNGQGVALVDFWAPWCGPCKKQVPIVDDLAKNVEKGVMVAKVNVDEQQELATEYQITSIPTLIVFKNGEPVKRMMGLHSKEQLMDEIKKHG